MSGMPRGWQLAWQRSVSIRQRVSGVGIDGPATLAAIREYDPAILVMWDVQRQVVTIWRQPRKGEMPVLVADSPFGHVIDRRLFTWLTNGDTYRYRDEAEFLRETVDKPKEQKERAKAHEVFEQTDHDRLHWHMTHGPLEVDGVPRGLFTQVPEQVVSNAGQ